ncbi:MAG: hypothetical protein LH478_14950 [Chitinophagaceae bacterium]|nr:hypothetical protein [Chitinophagaceae bacterium]
MKINNLKKLVPIVMIAGSLLVSLAGFSQTKKLPDGTVVYENGTKKLPNGTIIKKDGSILKTGGERWPDGKVRVPGDDRHYPQTRTNGKRRYNKGLPPGQAKKIYGGSAKDYAPGHQKKWKKNKNWEQDNDREHNDKHEGKHKGKGKNDD